MQAKELEAEIERLEQALDECWSESLAKKLDELCAALEHHQEAK